MSVFFLPKALDIGAVKAINIIINYKNNILFALFQINAEFLTFTSFPLEYPILDQMRQMKIKESLNIPMKDSSSLQKSVVESQGEQVAGTCDEVAAVGAVEQDLHRLTTSFL